MNRWRSVIDAFFQRSAAASPLVVGERYICDLGGRGVSLVELELVRSSHWVDICGEGVLQHGETAVFLSSSGDLIELAREDVLWQHDEHQSIVAAANSLGVPVIPRRRRPIPVWRLGTTRVGVGAMVEMGRLLTGRA